jgi:hypothetical protein
VRISSTVYELADIRSSPGLRQPALNSAIIQYTQKVSLNFSGLSRPRVSCLERVGGSPHAYRNGVRSGLLRPTLEIHRPISRWMAADAVLADLGRSVR